MPSKTSRSSTHARKTPVTAGPLSEYRDDVFCILTQDNKAARDRDQNIEPAAPKEPTVRFVDKDILFFDEVCKDTRAMFVEFRFMADDGGASNDEQNRPDLDAESEMKEEFAAQDSDISHEAKKEKEKDSGDEDLFD